MNIKNVSLGLVYAVGLSLLSFLWFYYIMFKMWENFTNATTAGAVVGYTIIFSLLCLASIIILILLGLGYFYSFVLILEDKR